MATYICYNCKEENDIDDDMDTVGQASSLTGGGDHFDCSQCEERNYVVGTRTMDRDSYYESVCESVEAARYEEAAYGHDIDDHFAPDIQTFRDDKWDRED